MINTKVHNNDKLNKYNLMKEEAKKKLDVEMKKSNKISLFRGIIFLISISLFVLIFTIDLPFYVWLATVPLFIGLIIWHMIIDNKVNYYQNYLFTIDNYISRIKGTYIGKPENSGMDFYDKKECFLEDLDIIGKNSLYKYICVARTHLGKRYLYEALNNNKLNDEDFIKRQEAIKELGENLEFCIDFEAKSYKIPDNSMYSLLANINLKGIKLSLILGIGLSIIFITMFFLAGFEIIDPYMLIIPSLMQIILFFIFSHANQNNLEKIKDMDSIISSMDNILKNFEGKEFYSKELNLKSAYINKGSIGVRKLSRISDFDTIRFNHLIAILFNAFIPFSIYILYLYKNNIKKYSKDIDEGIKAYQYFEMLISLTVIRHVRDDVCIPIRSSEIKLSFKGIKHPLITNCVENDFETINGINVITGSNMSGKTSFMRTVGINVVLMNAGTFVLAKEFNASYFKLFTSMRNSDDITKGISTFYAELLKIKKPIEYMENNEYMLTLIDEVFSGTNSNDRITGAEILLRKLNRENSIVLITTHDFEICDLNIDKLNNYYFSEYYENEKILFDYKIKIGKCSTTNAKYLMKLVGIK